MKDAMSQEHLAHSCPKRAAFSMSLEGRNPCEQSTRQRRTHPPRALRVSRAEQFQGAAKDSPKLLGGRLQANQSLITLLTAPCIRPSGT